MKTSAISKPPQQNAIKLALLTALAVVLILTFHTQPVLAHAVLMSSTPARNSTVSGEELDIALHFNSRIDAGRSLLILVHPDAKSEPLTILRSTAPELMEAKAFHLPAGAYTLRWQVLASDGHISRGEIPFTVRKNNS